MRFVRLRSWAGLIALVSSLVVSTYGIALSEINEEERWSIDFGDISISEAFDQLTQITGIKIFTKTPLPHRISPKRYRNQSIEQILKDLLKNVNFAAVWHYSEKGIESIGILVFDRARAESRSMASNVKEIGIRRPLPSGAGPTRLHPSGQVNGSERDKGVKEPPAEPEKEGNEVDDKEEELEKSSTDDTSSPDSSDTTGSSSGEEGLPKDQ